MPRPRAAETERRRVVDDARNRRYSIPAGWFELFSCWMEGMAVIKKEVGSALHGDRGRIIILSDMTHHY